LHHEADSGDHDKHYRREVISYEPQAYPEVPDHCPFYSALNRKLIRAGHHPYGETESDSETTDNGITAKLGVVIEEGPQYQGDECQ
jgi:hypothetical protein